MTDYLILAGLGIVALAIVIGGIIITRPSIRTVTLDGCNYYVTDKGGIVAAVKQPGTCDNYGRTR